MLNRMWVTWSVEEHVRSELPQTSQGEKRCRRQTEPVDDRVLTRLGLGEQRDDEDDDVRDEDRADRGRHRPGPNETDTPDGGAITTSEVSMLAIPDVTVARLDPSHRSTRRIA